jgi:hypothetical protein
VFGVLVEAGLEEKPDRALAALCAHFKGDYATAPHDDEECPFANRARVQTPLVERDSARAVTDVTLVEVRARQDSNLRLLPPEAS